MKKEIPVRVRVGHSRKQVVRIAEQEDVAAVGADPRRLARSPRGAGRTSRIGLGEKRHRPRSRWNAREEQNKDGTEKSSQHEGLLARPPKFRIFSILPQAPPCAAGH